jgi:ABC-type amino acid transport substrate-binding protein
LAVTPGLRAHCPSDLRIGFNDSDARPMLIGAGQTFARPDPGWLVRLARRALEQVGCSAQWVRLPTRRLEAELEAGTVSVALLFGATDERLRRLAFPLDAAGRPNERLALVISQLSLVTTSQRVSALQWDGQHVAPGKRIGVVRGTAQDQIGQLLGLPLEPISSFAASISMLRAGRFDALLLNPELLEADTPSDTQGDTLVLLQPPVRRLAYFAAGSPSLQRQRPDFLPRYWQALCRAIRSEARAPRSGCAATP